MSLRLTPMTTDEFASWVIELKERFVALLAAGAPGRMDREQALAALERTLPRSPTADGTEVLWVHVGDRRVGHVWLTYTDGDLVVRDVRLDDPHHAGDARELLIARARESDSAALGGWWTIGDPSHEAFVHDPAFTPTSTNMALAMDSPQPAPTEVTLRDMTAEEFAEWEATEIESYAATRARNGESAELALKTARQQHADLLPDGVATDGHAFWIGESAGERVGVLWLDLRHPYAFVYNIEVEESARGRGYGRALMQAGAHAAQQAGARGVALNVFGDNVVARRLYDSLGYSATQGSVRMAL